MAKKSPFNFFFCSSRQMAYDKNMKRIVDLIDIFDKNTDRRIRNYLAKRYLKENMTNNSIQKNNTSSGAYINGDPLVNPDSEIVNKDEVTNYLLSDEANLLQLKHQQEKEMFDSSRQKEIEEEKKKKVKTLRINDSVDVIEFDSDNEEDDEDNNTITESSLSYISNETIEKSGYFPNRKYRKVENLNKQVLNQIADNSINTKPFEIENDLFKKKSLQYQGYKINLYITQTPDLPPLDSQRSLLEDFYNKIYISNSSKLSRYSKLDMRSRLNETPLFNNNSSRLSNKSVSSSRTELNRSSVNSSPAIIPESVISYKKEEKYFEKKHDNKIRPVLSNSKEINKIKNHNYLNELSKRSAVKDIIFDGMKKYVEPLFPLNSESFEIIDSENNLDKKTQTKTRANINKSSLSTEYVNYKNSIDQIDSNRSSSSSECKRVSFKKDLNEESILSGFNCNNSNKYSSMSLRSSAKKSAHSQPKLEKVQKTHNQIFDSYMNSLKKSGLINKNCLPIINKKTTRNSDNKAWNGLIQTK